MCLIFPRTPHTARGTGNASHCARQRLVLHKGSSGATPPVTALPRCLLVDGGPAREAWAGGTRAGGPVRLAEYGGLKRNRRISEYGGRRLVRVDETRMGG